MPFDSDAFNQRSSGAAEPSDGVTYRIGAAPAFYGALDASFEAGERRLASVFEAHAQACCPCGQDHSADLLAHKLSLSAGPGAGVRLVSEGTQYAPDGSPEYASIIVGGEVPGSTSTTFTLNIGDSITSQIEASGDQDWYRVQLTAGVTYEFTLSGTGGDILDDPFLEIMDSAGTQIAENDDGSSGLNSRLRYTPTQSGTFYINAHGWADTNGVTSSGAYILTAIEAPPLPTYTVQEIASYLINEGSSGGRSWTQTNITYNIEALTGAQRTLAERALSLWAAVTPLTFTRVTSGGNITFTNVDPDPDPEDPDAAAAYAQNTFVGNAITSSTVVITSNWQDGDTAYDGYTQQTYIHEIGHALGLGHAGPYNGTADWGTDNIYTNDSWAFTVMSYFDQAEADAFGSYRFVLGLQQADIVAIQELYGARPAGTYAGNTTFGFNSSAPGTNIDWSQFVLVQDEGTYRRPPAMTIYDTSGIDTINLSGFSQTQLLNLTPGTFSSLGDRPVVGQVHYTNVVAIAANTIIENAIGGSGNDTITGNTAANTITLGLGADTYVYAPNGGADTITDFSVSVDKLDLTAFSSSAALAAFNGRTSSGGGTLLTFGSGQTILLQNVSVGQLAQSNLVLSSSPPPPPNVYEGTSGPDVLNGTGANDTISGFGGNDTLRGYGGTDSISGGTGNDAILGGDGGDKLNGDDGNDTIRGEAGNDFIYGGVGTDLLIGGDGNDRVEGGDGDDTMYGGIGIDTMLGGAGNDRLYGEDQNDVLYGGANDDLLVGGSGDDRIYGEDGIDNVYAGTGNDTVVGGAGDDNLRGEAGEDVIYAGDGSDAILAGADDDRMYGEAGSDRLYGEAGDDLMFGAADNDSLRGGAGNDTGYGGTGSDILIGDDGNDTFYGEDGPDKFFGGNGNDMLIGAAGNDILRGDAGVDILNGGTGTDTFLGGTGADAFIIASSVGTDLDRIKDFEQGLDVIQLVNSGFANFAAVQAAMAVLGAHTIITLASGDRLIIDNILPGAFTAADFQLTAGAEPQPTTTQSAEPAGLLSDQAFDSFDFSGVGGALNVSVSTAAEGGAHTLEIALPGWAFVDQIDVSAADAFDWSDGHHPDWSVA